MGKRLALLVLLATVACASPKPPRYTLTPHSQTQPHYFIKIGAYTDPANAHKLMLSTDFPTQIIHMRDYFSVVSKPVSDIDRAYALLQKIRQHYPDAYIVTLYPKAHASRPGKADNRHRQLFSQAYLAYRQKRYEEALVGFDKVVIFYPDDIRARIYYLRTLVALKIYTEAETEAQSLLQQQSLSATECQQVREILSQIASGRKKHFFGGFITVGAGYDDNINLTTDNNTTQYGPYTLINDTRKTKSSYAIVQLRAAHTYKHSSWQLQTALYSYNELFHTASGNDLNFLDISTTWIKSQNHIRWMIPAGFNTSYLDSSQISYNLYTNPTLWYIPEKAWRYSVDMLALDNHSQYASGYDYRLISGGVGITYTGDRYSSGFYLSRQSYEAKEVIRYDVSRDVSQYRFFGEYQLCGSCRAGAGYQSEAVRYSREDPVMGYHREDDKAYYTLYLCYTLTPQTAIKAFYRHTDVSSNVNTFSYTKNNFALLYQKRF